MQTFRPGYARSRIIIVYQLKHDYPKRIICQLITVMSYKRKSAAYQRSNGNDKNVLANTFQSGEVKDEE